MFGCASLVRFESLFTCLFSGWWSGTGGPSALQLVPPPPPPKNGRALGDSRACLARKCIRGSLLYLGGKKKERRKKRKKNQQFSHLAIRCFYGYVVQAAGPCERVRGGGPWEKRAAFG